MTNPVLHFLTVNTGHVLETPRSEIAQTAVDKLLPLIDAEGAIFPDLQLAFDIMRPLDEEGRPVNGAAFFQIAPELGMSKTPYAMCVGCWDRKMSEDAWHQLRTVNTTQRPAIEKLKFWKPLPMKRPSVPWLGVVLTPFILLADREQVGMMGDMERCLFWALAEGS